MVLKKTNNYSVIANLLSESEERLRTCFANTRYRIKALANQRLVLVIFLDIEKAYDRVYKDILLLKLLKLRVSG